MNSIPKFVYSSTLKTADWKHTSIIKDAISEIPKWKQEDGGDLFVFGSGDLSASLFKANLFDEIRLCLAPVILGKGNRLFPEGLPHSNFKLLDSKTLSTGGIIAKYLVEK